MMMTGRQVYTIGYSNLQIEEFIRLLNKFEVEVLTDVRSRAMSRRPEYCERVLRGHLHRAEIKYINMGRELGARRKEQSCYEGGVAVYERIAELPRFQDGIRRILEGVGKYRVVMMCAEGDPFTCHRAVLVSRILQEYDIEIHHIMSDGTLLAHVDFEEELIRRFAGQNLYIQHLNGDHLKTEAYRVCGNNIAYRRDRD